MSETIQGLSLGLGLDTAGIDLGMKQLRGKLAAVNAEMKANLSAFDYGEKSVAKYQTQLDGLNKKLEVQKAAVNAARTQYEKMVAEHGEGSKQAERAATAFNKEVAAANNLQRHISKLSGEFNDFQRELAESESKLSKFHGALDGLRTKMADVGNSMRDMGSNMTASLTAPIAGFGVAAVKSASDFEAAQGKLQAKLGLTADEAKELNAVARNLWKQGFGESIDEASNAVTNVYQTMGNLPADEIEKVTAAAFALGEAWDADVNETTRAAAQLMQQFGVSSTEAMDMITVAFKRGGNYSGELLDSISEYSTQFANMGFSAEQMMGMFASGVDSGIFSVDKLADTVKESFLQITDGADNTRSALGALGLDASQVESDLAAGGEKANAAFMAVMTAIAGVSDEAERNRLAIELMGTPLEDLGPQYQSFFANIGEGMTDHQGAAEEFGRSMRDNFGERLQNTLRTAQESLIPVGETLAGLAENWIPKITGALQAVNDKFTNMSPAMQNFVVISGIIAAALGPVIATLGFFATGLSGIIGLVGRLIGPISTAIGWLSKLGPAFTAIRTAIGVLSGPIGWVTLAVSTLAVVIYKNWDTIRAKTVEIFTAIGGFLKASWTSIKENVSLLVTNIKDGMAQKWTDAKNKTVEIFNGVKAFLSSVWNGIKSTVSTIVTSISTWIASTWQKVQAVTSTVFNAIKTFLTSVWNGYKTLITVSVNAIRTVITTIWNAIRTVTSTVFNAIKSFLSTVWNQIRSAISNVINAIKTAIVNTWNNIKTNTSNIFNAIKNFLVNTWNSIKNFVSQSVTNIKDGVIKGWSTLKSKTEEIFGNIKRSLSRLWDDIVGGAKKLPGRIGDGLKKMAGEVGKGVKAVGNKLAEGLENGLNGAINGINWVLERVNAPKLDPVKIKRYARGTKGHPGGPAIVGDRPGGGDGPAELIGTPDGNMYLSPAKETIIPDLPKGSWVMPGKETKAFLSGEIPAYNSGVGDFVSGVTDKVKHAAGTVKDKVVAGARKVKNFALDVWDYLDDVPGMMKQVWSNFIPDISMEGALGDVARGGINHVKDKALGWVKDKISSIFMGDGWTGGMEKDPRAVGPGSGFGGMMKYVEYWYNQVKDRFGPTRFMGAYNNRNVRGGSSKSMHAYGRAFDIGGSHQTMSKIAEFLRKTAYNIQYVIYNRKIAGPGPNKPWRVYNGVNPHTDHVHADFLPEAGGGASNIKGGAAAWRPMILKAAAQMNEAITLAQVDGIIAQIQRESSGNPRIVQSPQVNDINMRNGNPARGLLQYIPSTFRNYAVKGYNDIYNGYHQLLAFFNNTNWRKDLPYGKRGWGPTGSRKYAGGTDFHPGGPAVVNDAKGSKFKELIQLPSGRIGMFDDRNVMVNLPRGSKVLPGDKTKKLMEAAGIPRYAEGIGDMIYTVKRGDTLTAIARAFKTTVEKLVDLNKIQNKNLIRVGQKIIYGQKKAQEKAKEAVASYPTSIPEKRMPVYNPRPTGEPASDVEYLVYKYSKDVNNEIYRLEQAHNARMVALEKEREDQIKAIKDKAAKENRSLTQKEKEAVWKLRDDYAAREKQAEAEHTKSLQELEQKRRQVRIQEIDAYVQRKKEAGEMSLMDEIKVQRESIRYLEAYTDEWYDAQRKLNQLKVQLHEELMALEDEYLAKVKDVNQRVIEEERRLNDEYKQALESRANSLQNFAGLFDYVDRPEEIDPKGLIDNLHSQVWTLNNWRSNLDVLARRGIDQGLLEELQAMGPQALGEIKALNNMTDSQLSQFEGLWKAKSEAARKQATKELAGMKQDTLKQIEQLHRDAERELEELNATFLKQVQELRTGAVQEFQPFGAQLVDIGKNAIQGLMDGMKSMETPLGSVAAGLAETIKKSITDSLVIKSPSRWMKSMVGENIVQGVIDGIVGMKREATNIAGTMSDWFKPSLNPISLQGIQDFAGSKRTDAMKLLALAARSLDSSYTGGNAGSGQVPNVSTQNNQEINVYLTYNGSASREDMMGLVDFVESELAKRARIKRLINGVEG